MNKATVICIGVKNVEESYFFYKKLGFSPTEEWKGQPVAFFNTVGTKLELYPLELLAKDINEENPPKITTGFSGFTLAHNVASEKEVDAVIELARTNGATIAKEPRKVFWGGYSGYFVDPNGYYWEVAYNPGWKFDENGFIIL
jgi:catechol 2,3-dioxygenase-like lactoylglutathione lyase family enzyme